MRIFRALLASCLSLCLAYHVGRFPAVFRGGCRPLFRHRYLDVSRSVVALVDHREGRQHPWLRLAHQGAGQEEGQLRGGRSYLEKWAAKKAAQLEEAASIREVFRIYTDVLQENYNGPVSPHSLIAYQSTIKRVAYQVVKFRPESSSETDLMDSLTDVHLNAIEGLLKGKVDISEAGGYEDSTNSNPSDGFDDRSNSNTDQTTSCYQFAGLAHFMYSQVSSQLGASTVISPDIRDLPENMWMSPVLARLQRRCPSFVASEAEERIAAIYAQGFENMVNDLKLELPQRMRLPAQSAKFPPSAPQSLSPSELSARSAPPSFPAWELACSIENTLRDSLQQEEIAKLEQSVANALRQSLATRMHTHTKAIESLARSQDTPVLSKEHTKAVEHYLDLAHESVAAVFALWQVRHNLVGVPVLEGGVHNGYRKDYLHPVVLPSPQDINATSSTPADQADRTLHSVPPLLRYQVAYDVEQLAERLQPNGLLTVTALLAAAVRYAAGEDFRALSTYTSAGDSDEQTIDRDAVYFVVLAEVLAQTLTAQDFDERTLYLNLLAFVALEETMGVREPRAACRRAFEIALRAVLLRLRRLIHTTRTSSLEGKGVDTKEALSPEVLHFIADVRERLYVVSQGLGMILRLPEGEDHDVRMGAFTDVIEELLSEGDAQGRSNMRDVTRDVPWMSLLLSIDPSVADNLLSPLGQMKFDKLVGELLLNADVAVSMPELGATFVQQVLTVAESLLISPAQAEARVVTLAGAVLSSLLERCIDAHQKSSFAHVDAMLLKAFYIYEHPLLKSLQAKSAQNLKEAGLLMAITQVGEGGMMDLIRMVEGARTRHSSNKDGRAPAATTQGWGSSESSSAVELPGLLEFIQSMQSFLLQEFTTGGYKQRGSFDAQ